MKLCMTTNLKALKVMTLDQVTLTDEVMGKVLSGCPSLEDMSLIECYGLKSLVCENPNLKRVNLTLTYIESNLVVISCAHPISLNIDGWVVRVCLLRASSADISIFFSRFECSREQPAGVRRLMKELSKCRTFRPCLSTILVFTVWNFTNVHCPCFEWKNLILELGMTKSHHPGLSLLLRNSQSLETLTLNFFHTTSTAEKLSEGSKCEWLNAHEFDLDEFWGSQESASFPFLTTITINRLISEPYVVDIVGFLLRSAPNLEKLVISTQNLPKLTDEESCDFLYFTKKQNSKMYAGGLLQDLSQKFESLPRGSTVVINLL